MYYDVLIADVNKFIHCLTTTIQLGDFGSLLGERRVGETFAETAERLRNTGHTEYAETYDLLETRWHEVEEGKG